MELIIEKMAAGAKGLAHYQGKIVFVPGTLPGERVVAEPLSAKRDFIEATLVSVQEPSPQRKQPPCPLSHICGGCDFPPCEYPYQLELKKDILLDILRRAGFCNGTGGQPDFPVTVYPSPLETSYRNRFRFRIIPPGIPSLTARKTNNPVPVDDCICAVPELRAALKDGSLRRRITAIYAAETAKKRRPMQEDNSIHVFAAPTGRIAAGSKTSDTVITEKDTETRLSLYLCGKILEFDVRGFFQSNIAALEQLIPQVSGNLSGDRALDLYCGAGTFSVFLQENFAQTVLMEHNAESLRQAEINLRQNRGGRDGHNAVCCAVSDKYWPDTPEAASVYDAVIADPPRQGLTPSMVRWLGGQPAAKFRYVSCNPVTMARDIKQLAACGYTVDEIQLHDFYPQTSHMETVCLMSRIPR